MGWQLMLVVMLTRWQWMWKAPQAIAPEKQNVSSPSTRAQPQGNACAIDTPKHLGQRGARTVPQVDDVHKAAKWLQLHTHHTAAHLLLWQPKVPQRPFRGQ
jgi:hypothetical protein